MGKYFNVKFRPDIVNGDISDVIDNDKTDKPYAANDVLFDWQTIEIPKGGGRLLGVTMVINGEDGVAQAARDIELIFARSVDGVAPTTIGIQNETATCLNIQNHVIGALTMDKEYGVTGTDSCNILSTISGGADQAGMPAIVLEGESSTTSGYKTGYDTIYVAGITSGALDFSTGVLSTEAIDASTDQKKTIAVDTVDARLVFSVGDKAYVHDVDTQIPGTVSAVGENLLTFNTTNSTVDVANNDEIINATPIKIVLHCEK
tara:strand:- start:61 stop:843 length:783 start_codon:yes stop_codon:yes gene_type:complete